MWVSDDAFKELWTEWSKVCGMSVWVGSYRVRLVHDLRVDRDKHDIM
jgi:hypothetical protein